VFEQFLGRSSEKAPPLSSWGRRSYMSQRQSVGLLFLALNRSHPGVTAFEFAFQSTVIVASRSTVGVLIASHRPTHPIGWLFGVAGFIGGVHLFCGEYAIYALVVEGGSLPGGVLKW
jgi:hypothetical protein